MAILKGFPPSNTISPTIHIPVRQPKKNVWIERAKKKKVSESGYGPQFKSISIPLIRRVFPALIAAKLFNVQELPGPTGLVYYLREVYGKKESVAHVIDD